MPTKFCPHCGERNGFQVNFNIVCRIGGQEDKGYLRTCRDCGGRFITIQKDERITGAKETIASKAGDISHLCCSLKGFAPVDFLLFYASQLNSKARSSLARFSHRVFGKGVRPYR